MSCFHLDAGASPGSSVSDAINPTDITMQKLNTPAPSSNSRTAANNGSVDPMQTDNSPDVASGDVKAEEPDCEKAVVTVTIKHAGDNGLSMSKPPPRFYWWSPLCMIGCFFFGLMMSVAHHLFYSSLEGHVVKNQQINMRFGIAFAWLAQISLVGSVTFAYVQVLWWSLKRTEISIDGLDAAFAADSAPLSLFNTEMLRKIKLGSALLLILWCLPIPSLVTPATLFVVPSTRNFSTEAQVPMIDISTGSESYRFAYTHPTFPNTIKGVTDTSKTFVGPRTILSRLSTATAALGQILPISPPSNHSSYSLQFHAPVVRCDVANSSTAAIIDHLLRQKMSTLQGTVEDLKNAYYAFVPSPGSSANSSAADVSALSDVQMQTPSRASNQIWLTFLRYVINEEGEKNTERHNLTCQLYNASYNVGFVFGHGIQTISNNGLRILNPVFSKEVATTSFDNVTHSYTAYFRVISDQIVGSMGFYKDTAANTTFSEIATELEHSSLLGSSDLDVFFDYNRLMYQSNTDNGNISDQRLQDIFLARNRTLAVLIEELSFNTTVSLMSNDLLSPPTTTPVLKTVPVNIYAYNSHSLFLSYGLAIFFTLIANLLGGYGYKTNKASHDRQFSTIMSATTDLGLSELFHEPERRGSLPIPPRARKASLRFVSSDGNEGSSFRVLGTLEEGKGRRFWVRSGG